MARRDRRREQIRDALAEALVKRVRERLRGSYQVGVRIMSTGPGIRVSARIDETVVERVVWPRTLVRDIDAMADELIERRQRREV